MFPAPYLDIELNRIVVVLDVIAALFAIRMFAQEAAAARLTLIIHSIGRAAKSFRGKLDEAEL